MREGARSSQERKQNKEVSKGQNPNRQKKQPSGEKKEASKKGIRKKAL